MKEGDASLLLAAPIVGLLSMGGCARSVMTVQMPPSATAQLDLSRFQHVWIAGFVTTANGEVDLNAETARILRSQVRSKTSLRVVDADPIALKDEDAFASPAHWKRLGEEYGAPLIVTGSMRLTPAPPRVAAQRVGGRSAYIHQKGVVLESTFVFIDGDTGAIVFSKHLPRQIRYATGRRSSILSLYFELMDRILPDFLRAINGQRGEEIRHLLKE